MDKKLVLLVDDDPDFVDAVQTLVKSSGYDVMTAYDGKECMEQVATKKPDIIILDVMMPVMDGHETCDKLKSDPATAGIPIILLTAVADRVTSSSYTHMDMMQSEADDYIPKPVEPDVLLSRIKDLL